MGTDLSDISNRIGSLISDSSARMCVVVEKGYDEAGLVATRDGYLRLAQALIDFVHRADAGKAEVLDVGGVSLTTTSAIGYIFDQAEVVLDTASMAHTAEDVRQTVEYFRHLSPQTVPQETGSDGPF